MPRALAAAALLVAACGREPGELDRIRPLVLAVHGHVVVLKKAPDFAEYPEVAALIAGADPRIAHALPMVIIEANAKVGGREQLVKLKGIELERTPLPTYLVAGRLPGPAGEVAIGDELARALGVGLGDPLPLRPLPLFPDRPPPSPAPERSLRVVGVLHLGMIELDRDLALTSLAAAQEVAGQGDQVTAIDIRLRDHRDAAAVAELLRRRLGVDYHVVDWCELNRELLRC